MTSGGIVDLSRWLRRAAGQVARRWTSEVSARNPGMGEDVQEVLREFHTHLVACLPPCLGPMREEAEPRWREAAELYGALAGWRGLAAGEVVEEFQILREALLRAFLSDPERPEWSPLLSREVLRLNRVVDMGVTQASVGYADVLFFALLQGSGAPEALAPGLLPEVWSQLETLRRELGGLLGGEGGEETDG